MIAEDGTELPADRQEKVRSIISSLQELAEWERGLALAWFCNWCYRYVEKGDVCLCQEEDE